MQSGLLSNNRLQQSLFEYLLNALFASRTTNTLTHYARCTRMENPVKQKHLRKPYLSQVNHSMGNSTSKLSFHSPDQSLKDHYFNPTIIEAIEMAVIKANIFG